MRITVRFLKNDIQVFGTGVLFFLIITLGFALMVFSDFAPSALFGLLTGLAMVTALLADLCVLPVLLRRFVRHR